MDIHARLRTNRQPLGPAHFPQPGVPRDLPRPRRRQHVVAIAGGRVPEAHPVLDNLDGHRYVVRRGVPPGKVFHKAQRIRKSAIPNQIAEPPPAGEEAREMEARVEREKPQVRSRCAGTGHMTAGRVRRGITAGLILRGIIAGLELLGGNADRPVDCPLGTAGVREVDEHADRKEEVVRREKNPVRVEGGHRRP
eukprot:CAMPEP_0119143338 /NCGR_PEP_ID=MMETSP1310-20130426/34171_1 /TAXON_ID=464262 /ORGANISM="Genus nov. species nov., Strain RCC2339" /LENGTH=193 /DNA_ID=CAMNT_0007134959 /DNA_START=263 /DNA_END=844 /DNA_ORIENTATION=+